MEHSVIKEFLPFQIRITKCIPALQLTDHQNIPIDSSSFRWLPWWTLLPWNLPTARYSYGFLSIPISLPWNLRITRYSYRFLSIPMAAQNYQISVQILQNSYGCPGGHCRPGAYRCQIFLWIPMYSNGRLGGPPWSVRIAKLIVFLQTWRVV